MSDPSQQHANGSPSRPDDLDRRILASLRADPRQTNKALGAEMSVSEVTIAARIRALESAGLMKIMAQRDFRTAGFHVLAHVSVSVAGRSIDSVAQDLGRIDGVAGISIVMGDPPLLLMAMAASLHELEHLVHDQIARVDGVRDLNTMVYSDIIKHESEYASL